VYIPALLAKVIRKVKAMLAEKIIFKIDKSISEIAYHLGFKYQQHFTRFFKQKTGM
jgi:AraC-like DNA-binding protein